MRACRGKTKNGRPCQAAAGSDGYCAFHSPKHGRARAAGRRAGGRRNRAQHGASEDTAPRTVRTLADVLRLLDYALAEAMPLENSVQRGRLLISLGQAFMEAISAGEFEARLAALEAALADKGPGR